MSSERKLFEKEYCKAQMITDKGGAFEKLPNGDYIRHSLQLAWLMWQASAKRQGYKLVPVDPCEKTLNAMWEALDGNAESMDCIERSYKAITGEETK